MRITIWLSLSVGWVIVFVFGYTTGWFPASLQNTAAHMSGAALALSIHWAWSAARHNLPERPKRKRHTLGSWSAVANSATIGDGTVLGSWSMVGERSVVGQNVQFGSWAKIGDDVVLGDGVVLGSHTIVQSGVTVAPNTSYRDGDLVTPTGVIPNRTGGHSMAFEKTGTRISAPFGCFIVPPRLDSETLIEDYMWGRSDELDKFRVVS